MADIRENIFDSTIGANQDKTWLDSKVMRRELTEDLHKESLSKRAERANEAARSFLGDLTKRAEVRHGLEERSIERRRREEDILRQKADEYRERLRKYLRPELRADQQF